MAAPPPGIAAAGSEKDDQGFRSRCCPVSKTCRGTITTRCAPPSATTPPPILVEPVQGEGGIRPLPDQCLKGLRDLCDEHGLLLIFDEVQCGMGRTGKLFAHEWAGVDPDIMMVAKGIGGGFPLGAVLANERAASAMTAGTHGSTYGGNPLACAVGCAVMDIVADPAFLAEVNRKAGLLAPKARRARGRSSGGVRGGARRGPDAGPQMQGRQHGCGQLPGYAAELITVPAADNVIRLLAAAHDHRR